MEPKKYLIISKNTAQMLLVEKTLRMNKVETEMVPAPPESGTICAIAVKVQERDLDLVKDLLHQNRIDIDGILEDRKLKLQGLINRKLGEMVTPGFLSILQRIEEGEDLGREEIVYLLSTGKKKEIEAIEHAADRIRKEMVGDVVEIRGAVEFSNYCTKKCQYCGINASNTGVDRYRMSEEEILQVADELHGIGIRTLILQSGEDPAWTNEKILDLVKKVKQRTGMRITLSVGERTREAYEEMKKAGADNFLLKIETTNKELFEKMHPDSQFDVRIACSKYLKELGYINGSGNIVGLPGQTIEDIADDILYFKQMGINMIGIGSFIPAKGTELEHFPHGDIGLTLRTMAVTRIVCKKVYIPSTTALASLDKDAQVKALLAGANTIMLINTPPQYRERYRIYNNKNMVDLDAAVAAVQKAGRKLPAYLNIK